MLAATEVGAGAERVARYPLHDLAAALALDDAKQAQELCAAVGLDIVYASMTTYAVLIPKARSGRACNRKRGCAQLIGRAAA